MTPGSSTNIRRTGTVATRAEVRHGIPDSSDSQPHFTDDCARSSALGASADFVVGAEPLGARRAQPRRHIHRALARSLALVSIVIGGLMFMLGEGGVAGGRAARGQAYGLRDTTSTLAASLWKRVKRFPQVLAVSRDPLPFEANLCHFLLRK